MTSTKMSGPLVGLVGSKNRSLRPCAVVDWPMYRHEQNRSNRIMPYGCRVDSWNRHARTVGRGNFLSRGARLDQSAVERWSIPDHLANRNANEYCDKEVTKASVEACDPSARSHHHGIARRDVSPQRVVSRHRQRRTSAPNGSSRARDGRAP